MKILYNDHSSRNEMSLNPKWRLMMTIYFYVQIAALSPLIWMLNGCRLTCFMVEFGSSII